MKFSPIEWIAFLRRRVRSLHSSLQTDGQLLAIRMQYLSGYLSLQRRALDSSIRKIIAEK